MQYRPFGKVDFQASALGFGCMRFPKTESGAIDEAVATQMLYYAIDNGVNYLDTGYPYHGGESERLLGKVLKGSYRRQVKVATKMPCWAVKTSDDFDRLFDEQRNKLQTDHIDFYLLHGLSKARWPKMRDLGVRNWLDTALADGRIGGAGFSFHDSLDLLKEIIESYDQWSMCQIQYNYMNEEIQAGTAGLQFAANKGLAVVIMEPLLGGRLASPPESVQAVWAQADTKHSPVEWAMRWLWHKPEVSVVLSGMSTMQQVVEDVEYASRSGVGAMTDSELATVARARDAYQALTAVPCTACGYCMPCPNGVDIPRNMAVFNAGLMYGTLEEAKNRYHSLNRDQTDVILGSSCVQCLDCESLCPQGIPISEWMPYIHEILDKGRPYDPAEQPPQRRT